MKNKQSVKVFVLVTFVILLFLKIDYRFKLDWECCTDEFDYYSHAKTIAIDFDLDYSNQFEGFEEARFYKNNKSAPLGFFGTGLLSSPFVFVGNFIDNLNIFENSNSKNYNYKILFFSFASTFYFALGIRMFYIICKKQDFKNNLVIPLLIFGSGLPYYVFERYGMSHAFDFFTTTLVIFTSYRLFEKPENIKYVQLSFSILLSLLTRWTNYYVFFIPLFIKYLFFKNKKINIYKNLYFLLSIGLSSIIFLLHSKLIYGSFTVNPNYVYEQEMVPQFINFFLDEPVSFIYTNFINSFKIIFSFEFGLFWLSPILFFGILNIFIFLIKKEYKLFNLSFIVFIYFFGITLAWGETGSSYGYRYILPLVPLSILFYIVSPEKKILNYYLIPFSIFSTLSILFFEANPGTQLSTELVENTFGNLVYNSQPNYIPEYIKSFTNLNSYLIIFATSFFAVVSIKLLTVFLPIPEFVELLNRFNLPTDNEDFQRLLGNIETLDFYYFTILFLFIFLIYKIIFYKLNN